VVIGSIACGPRGGRSSARRIGEVPATLEAWHAAIRRVSLALSGDVADGSTAAGHTVGRPDAEQRGG
jgi:hypothetical protein